MNIFELETDKPDIDDSAYIAPTAVIIGKVTVGKNSSVWFNTVIRGDDNKITIGEESNIQDLTTIHGDPNYPVVIGDRVTVGHNCIIHGCTIEDDCLIGMGAIILNGAQIGAGAIIAAGTVVKENETVPPRSLVAGIPGQVKKTLSDETAQRNKLSADHYTHKAQLYLKRLR